MMFSFRLFFSKKQINNPNKKLLKSIQITYPILYSIISQHLKIIQYFKLYYYFLQHLSKDSTSIPIYSEIDFFRSYEIDKDLKDAKQMIN